MSIGEVLGALRPEFPDITISKIRFLEGEGLVEPSRTPSGYRKFSHADVERLRYVLTAQRDYYLPLRVIKENLDAIDRGAEPPNLVAPGPRGPRALAASDGLPTPDAFARQAGEARLSRADLLSAAGIDERQLSQLESFGLVTKRPGGHYDGDALLVASIVAEMGRYGLEPRHLRPFKSASDREVGLIEQVVAPLARQRNAAARARTEEVTRELAALSVRLHAALVKTALRHGLSG
jgi:DNA-binding transcriptional MerR regulator